MTPATAKSNDRRNFGIAGRLTAAFVGIAALAAIAGASSSWYSMKSSGIVKELGDRTLPTVTESLAFAQESAILLAEAPNLVYEPDLASLDASSKRLEAILAGQSGRLTALRDLGVAPELLDSVEKTSQSLEPKLNQLTAISSDRIKAKFRMQEGVARALSRYKSLASMLRNAQVGAVDSSIERSRALTDLQMAAAEISTLISAIPDASDTELAAVKDQYDATGKEIDSILARLKASGGSAAMQQLVTALQNEGGGPEGLFALRSAQAKVNGQIADMLNDLTVTSIILGVDVKLIAAKEKQAARNAAELSRGMTQQTVAVNAATSFLVIAAALAALFYVRRFVTRRLIRLATVMGRIASGDHSTQVPMSGRDEITDMAGAVEVFRANAVANIRLEQEAEEQRNLTEDDRRRKAESDRLRAEAMAQATQGLGKGLKHLSAGDLTFRLSEPFADEFETLRADFNGAAGQLAETLRSVADAANAIDSGSREVSISADDLSKRTEQQAASLEETAAALDQITVNVANSSKRADEARRIAAQANTSASQSGQVVASAVDAMEKIEQSSKQVSNIIGVIDEIAFQTNLLALNAGVEAARAGEAGKGFAVVAQEVRELAQRSAKAAREIKELIRNSSVEVENGVKLVSETGTALKTIEGYIVTVNQHMDSIATSAREQSVGLAEVNTAVNQMDQVTQQNAAMVEESNAASATLAGEAGRLRDLISQFQFGEAMRRPASLTEASPSSRPVASPARRIVGAVAKAFSGNAAVKQTWEEF
ncbi:MULTISPECIES: methyl-accepting chemotaxis protein [Rhizobium/Agrobacterium group]|uniref:Rcorf72 n=6 Tax=Rhizobium/Agrobacterium group TaxID=227290 RepID=A8W083_RHIRH|nr:MULTISPECIES: methyl-accepting chemotaxis protein [Rhizobium/Agrobacterium group]ABW33629.1 rcorf72 [Rhizobium rhizogenes]MCZ7445630.1 methyl-accepting chemotaxis protein [Rhizobium rhizogenes]MCZ7472540.1 methyl-accepting chemotaxis protein [Rhizobium rhizogenes]MCZ7483916.1 methyl-accepting chemotaxis protein [Rhizobium rhizogenes]MCZ7497714.1 methyl-accepting chemotaxis protein [Rhizobium rhizogenes]